MAKIAEPDVIARWQRKIGNKYQAVQQQLIPILQYVQSEEGYLPPEGIKAVARFLKMPLSKIYGVASFYAQFHFEPRGQNTVTVCRGTACHVRGSARLLQDVQSDLGINPGETSEDLLFSLETVACFGACARAPVVVVNERVHAQQTSASCKKLVAGIRAGSAKMTKRGAKTKRTKQGAKTKRKRTN
jgi:NADH:ubiquinone oxidoreductase subunit E